MQAVKPVVIKEQCHAITKRRGLNRRCMHVTLRGIYCHQHERALKGLRIKTSKQPGAGFGVFTTRPIPKGAVICNYTGDEIEQEEAMLNPYALQIKKRPATFLDARETNEPGEGRWINDGRSARKNNAELIYDKKAGFGKVKALRDIEPDEEILIDYGDAFPWGDVRSKKRIEVVPERRPMVHEKPKKKVLVKPDHGPDLEDWPVPVDEPEPKPKAKRAVKTPQEKREAGELKRLDALQMLFSDEKFAHNLKIPVSKHIIRIPKQSKADVAAGKFHIALEKLLKAETVRFVKFVNQNPRNAMTMAKAYDIIDKVMQQSKKR